MIKVKAGELADIFAGLKALVSVKLPASLSFQISRFMRETVKELNHFERSRMELIDLYGVKDENGRLKMENDEYIIDDKTQFTNDLRLIEDVDIELNIEPITIRLKDIELEPIAMLALLYIAANDDIIEKEHENNEQRTS